MRILVTGSRGWEDVDAIRTVLDEITKQAVAAGDEAVTVVHGCAKGADMIADEWAREKGRLWPIWAERHPADWKKYGRRAGFVRNQKMVNLGADVCVAFIKDGSRGATQCADLAEDHSIRTERFMVRTDAAVLPDVPDGA